MLCATEDYITRYQSEFSFTAEVNRSFATLFLSDPMLLKSVIIETEENMSLAGTSVIYPVVFFLQVFCNPGAGMY